MARTCPAGLKRRAPFVSTQWLCVLRELISRQFPESLGVLVEAFPELLDHNVQFVRIVSGDGLADQIFDAVLKASSEHGDTSQRIRRLQTQVHPVTPVGHLTDGVATKETRSLLRSCFS